MERIQETIAQRLQMAATGEFSQISLLEIERRLAEKINCHPGNLDATVYNCADCLNRGYFLRVDDNGYRTNEECRCMSIRRNKAYIRASGLSAMLERYTFEAWEAKQAWQRAALDTARRYIEAASGWFIMAGRPGCGKTHLCTAICGALMERGFPARYMLWRDAAVRAKAAVNDDKEYAAMVNPLKSVRVLYIDDFFKAGKDAYGNAKVTPGDVNLAFELINSRYNDPRKLTIISTERTMGEILGMDEAVGSRIYERTKGFYLQLDQAENWRLQ